MEEETPKSEQNLKLLWISSLIITIAVIAAFLILVVFKTYKVTFNSFGGSYVAEQKVKKGGLVTKPADPVKDGYNFVAWLYNDQEYNFNSKVTKDMTLVASWEEAKVMITVTLDIDGKQEDIKVEYGTMITDEDLASVMKDDYIIKWKLNNDAFDIDTTPILDTITLKGEYVKAKTFEVKFDSDGGSSVATEKVTEGRYAKKPTNPTKSGYTFDAWYLDGKEYKFTDRVTKNITLKAKWIADSDVKKYTVTFNSDGGSSVASQTVLEGKTATKPTNPTKNGYTFKEWQLNGSAYSFSTAVTGNIVLKAVWEKTSSPTSDGNTKKYTVTFNSDGGSSVASQSVAEGAKATKPTNPTKNGYTFKEWQLDGKTYNFNTTVTKNITLKATWTKNSSSSHTIIFDSDGGSSVERQTVLDGSQVTRPANPTKSGYTFKEWQLNGSAYNFSTPVKSNLTLKAVWTKLADYTVTFNSDGGSSVASQTVTSGGKATRPANPTKSGYNFKEWQLNNSAYDFNTPVTGNITLTAKWTQKSYTIAVANEDNNSLSISLRVILTVKEEGTQVPFSEIKYSDGVTLCTGSDNKVNRNDIEGESSFIVVLSNGTTVTATLES